MLVTQVALKNNNDLILILDTIKQFQWQCELSSRKLRIERGII